MELKQFLSSDYKGSIMRSSQRQTHVYIIGQPGTGKSRLIESWFMQDVLAGNGAGIIDPHGDLFNHLTARIAVYPEVWKRVIIINPCDPKWAVPINPLVAASGNSAARMAWFLTDVVLKIWSLKMTEAP
ncbi:MAG: ATP-binding protein, partial [Pelolinea sp.]|nr:ATP-binding protein [Pelolinea sp.]